MYTDIFIPKDKIGDAEQGDVVLVHIEDWPKADSRKVISIRKTRRTRY
jgi:ribonuclease R